MIGVQFKSSQKRYAFFSVKLCVLCTSVLKEIDGI